MFLKYFFQKGNFFVIRYFLICVEYLEISFFGIEKQNEHDFRVLS